MHVEVLLCALAMQGWQMKHSQHIAQDTAPMQQTIVSCGFLACLLPQFITPPQIVSCTLACKMSATIFTARPSTLVSERVRVSDARLSGLAAGMLDVHSHRAASCKSCPSRINPPAGASRRLRTQAMTKNVSEADQACMRRALELARTAEGKTHPNPAVGCVVTKNGKVVGEGFHPQAGAPHAEVFALRAAGQAACGGTAYVTLEPCNHFGRTPPCAIALVEAGVSRVRSPPACIPATVL